MRQEGIRGPHCSMRNAGTHKNYPKFQTDKGSTPVRPSLSFSNAQYFANPV